MRFAGYAALFGRRDAARDAIRPGAFARSLAERTEPLPLYWQHRPEQRIGWVERVSEDVRGLRVVAGIDNPDGAAALALRRGAVTGLSFGYRARVSAYSEAGRDLLAVDLLEVSLVTHPLQHGARVHLVRSGEDIVDPGSTRVRFPHDATVPEDANAPLSDANPRPAFAEKTDAKRPDDGARHGGTGPGSSPGRRGPKYSQRRKIPHGR